MSESKPTSLPEHIFRAYDIRGIVGEDLNEDVVRRIGLGLGTLLRGEGRRTVAVGHDVRASSAPFAAAVSEGLRDAGMDVTHVGEVPTPLLYFATAKFELDGGVMITGSHNPIEYNGLKITRGVWPIWGDEITRLRTIAEGAEPVAERGSFEERPIVPTYLAELKEKFRFTPGTRIAIDCGNGTAGPVALPLFESLGLEVDALYPEPDATFPNHLPDPEVPKYMKDLCDKIAGGDFTAGFGFDGDSDRVGVIDEHGVKRSADHLVLIFARYLLEKLGKGTIIFDVKCSDFLYTDIARRGGTPILWKTGHSIIKEKMREEGAILAGELSGHICVMHDYYGFDDAFYAACLTLQIMQETWRTCSELFADIPETFYTPEVKVAVSEERKFGVVAALQDQFQQELGGDRVNTIDGVRATWDDGWMLIRASNTTANLTVRVEGRSPEARSRIAGIVRDALSAHPVDASALEEFID
jgi:phosphomannomutase/phosphoglucomutase